MNSLSATFKRILLATLIMGFSLNTWADDTSANSSPLQTSESTPPAKLPLQELRTFTEIFDLIKQAYVDEVTDVTLLENAIQGMLTELDPHSAYLKPESYKDLQTHTSGKFGGLGIEVGMEDGYVKVISPIDDTPAAKAGILSGDLIVKIDGQHVKGLTLSEAVKLMRGDVGSKIILTILRKQADKPEDITITRDVIKVKSVRSKLVIPDYGYVRLSQFQIPTGANLNAAIQDLIKENETRPLSGLILDLRNNPGGVLQAAADVTDTFLDSGLIVYTKGKLPDSEMQLSATPGDMLNGSPIVVLINGGSASASEIVAGALQDHNRAIIMGTQSFGKGSVQTVRPLPNNRALKLTTARYYTPKDRSIQAQGITPDIIVENATITTHANNSYIKESDLQGHLENPAEDELTTDDKALQKPLQERDYQLYEALNLLKALNVVSRANTANIKSEQPD